MANYPELSLLVLRVSDIEHAAVFYGALGLKFVRHRQGKGPEHYVCTMDGGWVLVLYPAMSIDEESHSIRLGFHVDSVEDTVERLADLGARIVTPPKRSDWGRRAVVRDPFGLTLELTTPGHR